MTACLLHNEPATYCVLQVKSLWDEAVAKASVKARTICST